MLNAFPLGPDVEWNRLQPVDRLDSAVRMFLASQMEKLRGQIPGIRQDADIEFVHRARVATRRMRSLLSLFQNELPVKAFNNISEELKWIGGLLGAVRDLDILLFNISNLNKIRQFKGDEKRFFVKWIKDRRRPHLDALNQAFESSRYKGFEGTVSRFVLGPLPRRPRTQLAAGPLLDVAHMFISDRLEAVMDQGRKVLTDPKIKQFHRLRIRVKKLRYTCEFFSPAFEGAFGPFIKQAADMQDRLGRIQDTVFMRGYIKLLLDDCKNSDISPSIFFGLGEIYQLQKRTAADCKRELVEAWGHFTSDETMSIINTNSHSNKDL